MGRRRIHAARNGDRRESRRAARDLSGQFRTPGFKHVAARSPIPWLHIAEEVAKAAVRGGYRHAALLGTRFTMSGPVYPEVFEKYALKISTPAEGDQKIVDDIIFKELVNGIFTRVLPPAL